MIIIYRRWGILTPVILILGAVLVHLLINPRGRMESLFFFIPAVLVSLTGILLDSKEQANDFYFVPMKYWGIIVSIFGIVILVKG